MLALVVVLVVLAPLAPQAPLAPRAPLVPLVPRVPHVSVSVLLRLLLPLPPLLSLRLLPRKLPLRRRSSPPRSRKINYVTFISHFFQWVLPIEKDEYRNSVKFCDCMWILLLILTPIFLQKF